MRCSRLEMKYFVASPRRRLEATSGSFSLFYVHGMTCRDCRVDAVLKSIVNHAANEFVLYVKVGGLVCLQFVMRNGEC